jgi:biotin carboxylase
VHEGRVVTIGVTDSQKYEGTNSFERFEFPSALPAERLAELEDVSTRLMPALRFDGGFFNVEFFIPDEGPARIIEVNSRMASQFWPLVRAVLGRSTYDAMFRLACGADPGWVRGRVEGVALSYCLRVFEDAYVESVPEVDDDELELLVRPGLRLSQQGVNDTSSYRLCIFPSFGATREEALSSARARAAGLDFGLSPLTAAV